MGRFRIEHKVYSIDKLTMIRGLNVEFLIGGMIMANEILTFDLTTLVEYQEIGRFLSSIRAQLYPHSHINNQDHVIKTPS
jgi:hypothetical protein